MAAAAEPVEGDALGQVQSSVGGGVQDGEEDRHLREAGRGHRDLAAVGQAGAVTRKGPHDDGAPLPRRREVRHSRRDRGIPACRGRHVRRVVEGHV